MSYTKIALVSLLTLLCTVMLATACQKDKELTPILPDSSGNFNLQDGSQLSGSTQYEAPRVNTRNIWGIWNIAIDPQLLEAEIVPVRGSEWHANVVEFLQPPFPPSNLGIYVDGPASNIPEGYFEVDITLTHPFPTLPEFRGFDVRGAFCADGTFQGFVDTTATYSNPDPDAKEARLLNADGYVRWFNLKNSHLAGFRY